MKQASFLEEIMTKSSENTQRLRRRYIFKLICKKINLIRIEDVENNNLNIEKPLESIKKTSNNENVPIYKENSNNRFSFTRILKNVGKQK